MHDVMPYDSKDAYKELAWMSLSLESENIIFLSHQFPIKLVLGKGSPLVPQKTISKIDPGHVSVLQLKTLVTDKCTFVCAIL